MTDIRLPTVGGDNNAWGTVLNDYLESSLSLNVKTFDATGDGSTDDTVAIQAALDAAAAAPSDTPKEIYFPPGIYKVNTSYNANGLYWCLSVVADNITIRGAGPASIIRNTTASAATFFFGGCGKPAGHDEWLKYSPWRYSGDTYAGGAAISPAATLALLPISAATRSATSVTCTTPANAATLAAGDTVVIRSGQIVANASNWNAEPDSEYNTVVSASGGTGVVVLQRPLAKAYAQEYQSAIGQISTTAAAAVSTPLAIVKATTITQENVTVENIRLETTTATVSPLLVRGIVDGLTYRNIQVECLGAAMDALEYRNGLFENMLCVMTGTHRADMWPVTVAVGCTDVAIYNLTGIAKVTPTLHIHEGSARVRANGIRLMAGSSATTAYDISIRARAYDVTIEDWEISGGGTESAIIIGDDCSGGGRIGLGVVRKPGMTSSRTVLVQAANWAVTPSIDGRGGDMQIDPVVRATLTPGTVRVLSGWLSDDSQTVTLGVMPAQSVILSVGCYVHEVFNSSGTDLVSIGFSGNNTAFASGIDVSTGFNKPVAVSAAHGYVDTSRTVEGYYVNGGGEPTTGKALVWIEFFTGPTHVA